MQLCHLAVATLSIAITLSSAPALAKKKVAKAHAHGQAKLDISVDGTKVQVDIDVPGDGIFGFEHRPKSEAEQKTVQAGLATLRDKATEMIVLPADADCKATKVEVESSLLDSTKDSHHKAGHESHSDVEVEYEFTCAKSPAGGSATLGIMTAFPRIKQIKVQAISGTTQRGLTINSAKDPVSL